MIQTLRRFFDNPRIIGAIAPSSPALVNAMTRQIDKGVPVFEIGAGTGAITSKILKSAPSAPLIVFEQDAFFAERLRRLVGEARVVEGLFHDTVAGLGEIPESLVILSSVPFMSLSRNLHARTVEVICDILLASPNRQLIQYTYFYRPPFVPPYADLHWRRLTRVWANIPPATVWELRAGIKPETAIWTT